MEEELSIADNYLIRHLEIHFAVFWVVTPCSVDAGRKVLHNFGILPQHYTASQPGRPRLKDKYL